MKTPCVSALSTYYTWLYGFRCECLTAGKWGKLTKRGLGRSVWVYPCASLVGVLVEDKAVPMPESKGDGVCKPFKPYPDTPPTPTSSPTPHHTHMHWGLTPSCTISMGELGETHTHTGLTLVCPFPWMFLSLSLWLCQQWLLMLP